MAVRERGRWAPKRYWKSLPPNVRMLHTLKMVDQRDLGGGLGIHLDDS
jgi:hypothetical protein